MNKSLICLAIREMQIKTTTRIPSHPSQNDCHQEKKNTDKEPSYTIVHNAN
jgi:hypothetical protein